MAPHVPADGEELTSVKSIQCQCTVMQKEHVVLYHGGRPTARKFGIISTKEHPTVVEELLWQIPHVSVDIGAP